MKQEKQPLDDIYIINHQTSVPQINKISTLENSIKDKILEFMINREINLTRLFFTNFPQLKIDINNMSLDLENGEVYITSKKNTVTDLYEFIKENGKKIIINLNSTIASTVKENDIILDEWKYNINWNYID
jgi:hypothetical protein